MHDSTLTCEQPTLHDRDRESAQQKIGTSGNFGKARRLLFWEWTGGHTYLHTGHAQTVPVRSSLSIPYALANVRYRTVPVYHTGTSTGTL